MNEQPEALRLADALDTTHEAVWPYGKEAAAELRRLHAENEVLRDSLRMEELISFRRQMQTYAAQAEVYEALLRQALEALEYYRSGEDYQPTPASEAIAAIKERLK